MPDPELIENQVRKLRRRIEEYLRHATPNVLLKFAKWCEIPIPKLLSKVYGDEESPE